MGTGSLDLEVSTGFKGFDAGVAKKVCFIA